MPTNHKCSGITLGLWAQLKSWATPWARAVGGAASNSCTGVGSPCLTPLRKAFSASQFSAGHTCAACPMTPPIPTQLFTLSLLPMVWNLILKLSSPTRRLIWYLLRGLGGVCHWAQASLRKQQLHTLYDISWLSTPKIHWQWPDECFSDQSLARFQVPTCCCCVQNLFVQVSALCLPW